MRTIVCKMIILVDIDQFVLVSVISSPFNTYNKVAITRFYTYKTEALLYKNIKYGQIPKEIFNIIHLIRLNLSHIRVSSIPKEIINSRNLKYMYLNYNDITTFDVDITKCAPRVIEFENFVSKSEVVTKCSPRVIEFENFASKVVTNRRNRLGERVTILYNIIPI